MIKFICDTGGEEYPADIVGGRIVYMKDNLRITLEKPSDDCQACALEIEEEANRITEEARARVRAKKQQ